MLFTLLALAMFLAPSARAAEEDFDKGLWTLQLYGGYMDELGPHDQEIAFGTVGVGYYVLENVSINVEFSLWDVNQPGDDAYAGMGGLMLRHHAFQFNGGSVFFDVGQFAFEADNPVPQHGTTFNWVFLFGGGITYQLSDNMHLMTGARYFHLSNAGREGDLRNPSLNGIQAFIGVLWEL